jgi:hypothetical protein
VEKVDKGKGKMEEKGKLKGLGILGLWGGKNEGEGSGKL